MKAKKKPRKQPEQPAVVASVAVAGAPLTSHDVAKALRVNPTSVNKWATEGHLKCYKTPGGHRRFNRSDVDDFAARFGMPVQHGA